MKYCIVKTKDGTLQKVSLKDVTLLWMKENVIEVLAYLWA